ncbi:MAG: bifunctional heptose 7-phosphate kinase/heptose 1-phosphate adenyltransferase [Armatimonadota bacterium]
MKTVGYAALSADRLETIIAHWRRSEVAVVGDFFLDRYLIIDPELTEPSLETGLDAYQVVEKRPQPGAAGTVTSNLAALELAEIVAVGVIGDDGEGYELRQAMSGGPVRTDHLISRPELMTPTYTKPMVREDDGSLREINRLDMRNREPTAGDVEEAVIAHLRAAAGEVDAVIIADQEDLPECGVITPGVVDAIAALAEELHDTVFWADSRGDISRFRNVIIKPNSFEACRAAEVQFRDEPTLEQAVLAGQRLFERNERLVVVTVGEQGLVLVGEGEPMHVPAVRVEGEIDIVGAGDSFTAGMVAGLVVGGVSPVQAALIGSLVASITIQQIGTTGTASPEQIMQRLEDIQAGRVAGR